MEKNRRAFATRAGHAGEGVRPSDFVPVASPIHPTVGFVYESRDELDAIFGAALSETRPAALVAEIISNPLLKVADLGQALTSCCQG